jgi:hypothetical protein
VLAALAAFAGQAAVVYKWTDSDGVVHYSDQPVPGAERIVTAGSPSPAGSVPSARSANPGLPDPKKNASVNYSQFAITSPAPEQTFFGDEVIGVHLAVEPALKPDQTITWHLNGRQLDDVGPAATSPASLGSGHLRHCRDRHGLNDGRIHEHGQRHLLRASAVQFVAPAPETLAHPRRQPDAPIGR